MPFALIIGVLLLGCAGRAHAGYTETMEPGVLTVDLQADYGVNGTGAIDDSVALQRAVDEVASRGGGRIDIPEGEYRLSGIQLKSHVHLCISKDAVIYPRMGGIEENSKDEVVIFTMGGGATRIKNASVRGIDGRFTVVMPEGRYRTKVVVVRNVDNFLIENFHVEDGLTVFSSISLNAYLEKPELYAMPENGMIRNLSVSDAQYGYGLIQAQAGKSIHFENLSGTGGVTLRLETGEKEMNDKQYGAVWDITAKNIRCKDGHAALMLGPHSIDSGVVVVDGIHVESCAFAMKGGDGFVAKKQDNPNLKPGKFAKGTVVKNIHAVFGTNAQLKTKDIKYVPEEIRKFIQKKSESRGQVGRGPSVTAVQLHGDTIKVENVTYEGFIDHPPVIHMEDIVFPEAWTWMEEHNLNEK